MGRTIEFISEKIGKHKSSIYRELKRNKQGKYYLPDTANKQYLQKRSRLHESKIRKDSKLYWYIREKLEHGWSPEQISGRMKRQEKEYYCCHETIYRYLYIDKHGSDLYKYLPKAKPRRTRRVGRKVGSGKYKGIKLISQRPASVETRAEFGHWEGDTVGFSDSKYANVTTLVERKSRFIILKTNCNRQSNLVINGIIKTCEKLQRKAIKTVTFDQGSEFARYKTLEQSRKCQVYFCNPHSPWQRGSNENANGRIRRYLPRNFKTALLTQNYIAYIAKKLNNTPRKVLNYMTPSEIFKAYSTYNLSHFKLE